MNQPLHLDEIEIWHGHPDLYMKKLEQILNTPDDSDIGYFIDVYLRYPDNIKKTKHFPFRPENKIFPRDKFNEFMKKSRLKNYTKTKKLICDWTDKFFFNIICW